MRPETAAALYDMRLAANRIAEAALGHDFESFTQSWILVSAVERQFGILGEALVRVREYEREVFDDIPDSSKIVGLRNLIVHGYDAIDPEVLWSIMDERLPALILVLEALQPPGLGH